MDKDKLEIIRHKKLAESFKVKAYDLNAVKDVDMTKRIVTGVSNMFYWFDSDYDVLLPGCSVKTINENGPASNTPGKIKHALFHDLTKLPSKVQTLDERKFPDKKQGQYFETKMLNTDDGNETLIKYQEQVYDQHSIGFRYMDIEMLDEDSDGWNEIIDKLINPDDAIKVGFMFIVKEIKQYEFSTVAFGANSLTPYLGVKSGTKESRILNLHNKIDRMAKLIRNGKGITDDGFINLELELLQLKQLLSESIIDEPSLKDTLLTQSRLKKGTQQMVSCISCDYSFDYLAQPESGMGYCMCPNCNGLVNQPKSFDLREAIKTTSFFN